MSALTLTKTPAIPPVVATSTHSVVLPSTGYYTAMKMGHFARRGHALIARLESVDGGLWEVVRECC